MKRSIRVIAVSVFVIGAWLLWRQDAGEPPRPRAPVASDAPDTVARTPPGVTRPGRRSGRAPSVGRHTPADTPLSPPATSAVSTERDRIPNEYVLGFYSWQESDAFVRAARELGIEILDRMALGNALRIRTTDQALLQRLMAQVSRPVHFGPNYYIRPPPIPPMDDKRAPESGYRGFGPRSLQWLGVGGDGGSWGEGVKVAILDTAVGRHPALPDGQVSRFEVDGGMTDGDASGSDHGTAVASLIIGNGKGLRGMAPAAEIISIPVVSADGTGDTFTLSRGIVEAVGLGADVINLSLGSYGDSAILREAVDYALENDVAVVASTGNDAVRGVTYPARYDGVVAVGAVDAEHQHVYFSNRGMEVDLTAPGVAVAAAGEDEQTGLFSGTSASAPFVSGAIAAVLSEDPDLSPTDAAELLIRYADDYGAPGRDEEYGSGILNMERVMDRDVEDACDLAVSPAYVDETAGGEGKFSVAAYAQNRGTVTAPRVSLSVTIDGKPYHLSFENVGVGETVSHVFLLDRDVLEGKGSIRVVMRASVEGVSDMDPSNDAGETMLYLGE